MNRGRLYKKCHGKKKWLQSHYIKGGDSNCDYIEASVENMAGNNNDVMECFGNYLLTERQCARIFKV